VEVKNDPQFPGEVEREPISRDLRSYLGRNEKERSYLALSGHCLLFSKSRDKFRAANDKAAKKSFCDLRRNVKSGKNVL